MFFCKFSKCLNLDQVLILLFEKTLGVTKSVISKQLHSDFFLVVVKRSNIFLFVIMFVLFLTTLSYHYNGAEF